ncbi:hypothetical protein V6N13_048347 [Hibiscus sabdariffa]
MKSFQLEWNQWFSSYTEESELKSFIQYIDSLKSYEKFNIPKDTDTESDDRFDLGRMRSLMNRLGNPQVFILLGLKGKDPLQLICQTSYVQKVISLVVILGK